MLESKSRECQLLKSINCSHHPSDGTSEGLHWTPFSPHIHLLKETHHLPPSSPTPWSPHGPDHPALPAGTNPNCRWALWDLQFPQANTKCHCRIMWTKRPRNTTLSLSASCSCYRSPKEMQLMTYLMVRSKSLTKPLPDGLHQKKYIFEHSHQDWDCQGRRFRVFGRSFREEKKKQSSPSPDEFLYKMVMVGYSTGS